MRALALGAAVLVALAQPPRGHLPSGNGARNVALGKICYARVGRVYAPGGSGEFQAGLQRLTDGVFAGRSPLLSRASLLLAPYAGDLVELPLASLPEDQRVTMASSVGAVEVDLGGVYAVEALLLEAEATSDYHVERSLDGRFWRSLWTAPAFFGAGGFVTRQSGPLARTPEARYLRVSGAATFGREGRPETLPGEVRRGIYVVSELQVFSRQARAHVNTILPGMDGE